MIENEEKSPERRSNLRINFREPVQYQSLDQGQLQGSVACDLSEDGIRINVNDFIPLNTVLNFQLPLTNRKVIDCVGKVVWIKRLPFSERYQAGFSFDESESLFDYKKDIHQFIQSNQ